MKHFFNTASYNEYIPPRLAKKLLNSARPVKGVPGLVEVGQGGGLEDKDSLSFLIRVYRETRDLYQKILAQRAQDRQFLDARVKACETLANSFGLCPEDPKTPNVFGLEDGQGRVVLGPTKQNPCFYRQGGKPVAPIPRALEGSQVTLFGPPDSAKMAINAMNAYHRKLPGEPDIVEELLQKNKDPYPIKWGADHEDSKTPLRQALTEAQANLARCYTGELRAQDPVTGKAYQIIPEKKALPIKRIPGLYLPCAFLFYEEEPLPLHLYELILHIYHHRQNPEALIFYVPKLENEEEAAYLRQVIALTESHLKEVSPDYTLGSVRVILVLENARAIFRLHEMMDALDPYFVGASLGWHDYLASAARLFKNSPRYRIPLKSDPEIVIRHLKEAHLLLSEVVGSRGGLKIGGMYGVLPSDSNLQGPSFQLALMGFFKDVITQLRRNLSGFWVAHPDFARIGLALVEAWNLRQEDDGLYLHRLIDGLFLPAFKAQLKTWLMESDTPRLGLTSKDPDYPLALLAWDTLKANSLAQNPEEIRYNVFQTLQYLADWLSGNGCVALPTKIASQNVRVMDDLATAERSRWEVWHEIHHGRFKAVDLIKIAHEELNFIRKNIASPQKKTQVLWNDETAKWYPVAMRIMLLLMTAKNPPECATELLLPFTTDFLRQSQDPLSLALTLCPERYLLDPPLEAMLVAFEACSSRSFALAMSQASVFCPNLVEKSIMDLTFNEMVEASHFHGDIGAQLHQLDPKARAEQSLVSMAEEQVLTELRAKGQEYRGKFGFKYLVSAKGQSAQNLLSDLNVRLLRSQDEEIHEAKKALAHIAQKRLAPEFLCIDELTKIFKASSVPGMSVAMSFGGGVQTLSFGEQKLGQAKVTAATRFQLASLSKTLAAAFATEFFKSRGIALNHNVTSLLKRYHSPLSLVSGDSQKDWNLRVEVCHLLSHTALSMHYVKGFAPAKGVPPLTELLTGIKDPELPSYDALKVLADPGSTFHYSGGGYLVLEHLIELISGEKPSLLIEQFLMSLGIHDIVFHNTPFGDQDANTWTGGDHQHDAFGYDDSLLPVDEQVGQLYFPGFAAGARGSAQGVLKFLAHLTHAYHHLEGSGPLSHDTAVLMLHGQDLGSRAFMGCDMGLGVFVAEAGPNRLAVHQGANEGFRSLFIQCFKGPDRGKGFVILCNGDQKAAFLIGKIGQKLLEHFKIQGFDFKKLSLSENPLRADMTNDTLSPIARDACHVNSVYKQSIFDGLLPDLPDAITGRNELSTHLAAQIQTEAQITRVSNQIFARAENLLSPLEPVFDPELYCPQGKVMDSWESRRHNPFDRDYLEFKLKEPKAALYAEFSTRFHDGNHPEEVRLLAQKNHQDPWTELIPKTPIAGHCRLRLKIPASNLDEKWTFFRVEMFPDGGLSRLRLYENLPEEAALAFKTPDKAQSERYRDEIPQSQKPLALPFKHLTGLVSAETSQPKDYATWAHGGRVLRVSNQHYGPADQVISPFPPLHMFDGLESKRSRNPDHFEEVEIQLGAKIQVRRVVADFTYYINNNPHSMALWAFVNGQWVEFIAKTPVKAFAGLKKCWIPENPPLTDRILARMYPDGGVHRLHVYDGLET